MIKPRLVKAHDILSQAQKTRENINNSNLDKESIKLSNWALEFKLEKNRENPREEWRKLWL